MNRLFLLTLLSVASLVLTAGCAPRERVTICRHDSREPTLIFNPAWTGLPSSGPIRRAWPVTAATVDSTSYRIHFRDTFRSTEARFPDIYRRVDQIRTGSHRR